MVNTLFDVIQLIFFSSFFSLFLSYLEKSKSLAYQHYRLAGWTSLNLRARIIM